jgi:hypothetical protein
MRQDRAARDERSQVVDAPCAENRKRETEIGGSSTKASILLHQCQ